MVRRESFICRHTADRKIARQEKDRYVCGRGAASQIFDERCAAVVLPRYQSQHISCKRGRTCDFFQLLGIGERESLEPALVQRMAVIDKATAAGSSSSAATRGSTPRSTTAVRAVFASDPWSRSRRRAGVSATCVDRGLAVKDDRPSLLAFTMSSSCQRIRSRREVQAPRGPTGCPLARACEARVDNLDGIRTRLRDTT